MTVEWNAHHEPVVRLDFGGGFVEAHGVRIDGSGTHSFHAEEE